VPVLLRHVRAPASSRLRAAGTRRCVPSDEPASPDAAGSAMVMEQLRGSRLMGERV
jgi:hypothetical protein